MSIVLFRRCERFLYPGADVLATRLPWGRHNDTRQRALDMGRTRLLVVGGVFLLVFVVIVGRLVEITAFASEESGREARRAPKTMVPMGRADITDRNGIVLATSLPTVNLYADPRVVLDPEEAARKTVTALPDLNFGDVLEKLSSDKSFVYLKRYLTPNQQYEINRRGIVGLSFEQGERRVYPHGPLMAHVIGAVDTDNHGIAGLEKTFNDRLTVHPDRSLSLSLDVRLQHIVRDELLRSVGEFRAMGGTGVIADVHTGELLAMVSLPDFDPNGSQNASDAQFNRATLGLYEMGSTFKLFTATAALDGGSARLESRYDATNMVKFSHFTIRDYHPQNRWLSVSEIMIHSSNIGAARMALEAGTKTMREYLDRLGLLRPLPLEIPETGTPIVPNPWREINTVTVSYGHGLAVTPVHMATAISTLVNGGIHRPATLIRRAPEMAESGERVLKPETSRHLRRLMRQVVEEGTGTKADVPGYFVGGKTGTAEKSRGGGYARKALLSSFVAAFPMDDPRYAVIVIIDEPEGNKSTFGYATGGWTAAPAVGRVVARMAPVLGIAPVHTDWTEQPVHSAIVRMVASGAKE
ncbi:MAG: cell division protein FtsI (penicillin-binding protein 3) [Rhodospirillaceae bacterium]|nr:MAG: cell division protein FtsI (penicillin-binding protein 3) [Rhodospirillaceae bacterium]